MPEVGNNASCTTETSFVPTKGDISPGLPAKEGAGKLKFSFSSTTESFLAMILVPDTRQPGRAGREREPPVLTPFSMRQRGLRTSAAGVRLPT